jgi:hypothetical protein
MARQTRKKNLNKVLTVPQLRKAFESVDLETRKILAKHPVDDSSVSEFQKLWKSLFHKPLKAEAARSYLELQARINKKNNSKRHTRKSKKVQKGGVAPVDYMLRPGIDGTHGSFLPYVSSGLSFYNDINNIAMDSDCGKVDITPQIAADMGSNQVHFGGASLAEISGSRIIPATVPPSILQDAQDVMLGRHLGASPSVLDTKYQPR